MHWPCDHSLHGRNLIQQATAGAKVSAVQARKEMNKPPEEAETLDAASSCLKKQSPDPLKSPNDSLGLAELKSAWFEASASACEAFLLWTRTTDQT